MSYTKRLIDANEAYEIARTSGLHNDFGMSMADLTSLEELFEDCTAVDAVEVVHGKWEYGKWENGHWVKGNERCRCSVCHRDFAVDHLNIWHGCPQCLAKMDGGNEDGICKKG